MGNVFGSLFLFFAMTGLASAVYYYPHAASSGSGVTRSDYAISSSINYGVLSNHAASSLSCPLGAVLTGTVADRHCTFNGINFTS